MDTIRELAIKTQNKLGAKHPESFYQTLLCHYIRTELNMTVIKEKIYPIYIDGIHVGDRRADIFVKELGMIIETKVGGNMETAQQQAKMYMELDDEATSGMVIGFVKRVGYPSKNEIQEDNIAKFMELYYFTK